MLRQKDAKGWAVYFGHSIKAKVSKDRKVLITENDRALIRAWRVSDGKMLWEHVADWSYEVRLLDVTDHEVFVTVPGKGQILTLSRQTGKVLGTRSHLSLD